MDELLVFGRSDGQRVEVGPFTEVEGYRVDGQLGCLRADVVVRIDGEELARRSSENGFEAASLPNLRMDLQMLRSRGRGRATFGDHDYGSLVVLEVASTGLISVQVSLPNADLWFEEVATMGAREVELADATIGRIEAKLGDLGGCIGCCGVPTPTYNDRVYPPRHN